jgi:hypothetical protein
MPVYVAPAPNPATSALITALQARPFQCSTSV